MHQSDSTTPLVASQALWTYSGISEENQEKDFYAALEEQVATELARRFKASERVWVGREIRLRMGSYIIHARLTNLEPLLATHVNLTMLVD